MGMYDLRGGLSATHLVLAYMRLQPSLIAEVLHSELLVVSDVGDPPVDLAVSMAR